MLISLTATELDKQHHYRGSDSERGTKIRGPQTNEHKKKNLIFLLDELSFILLSVLQ